MKKPKYKYIRPEYRVGGDSRPKLHPAYAKKEAHAEVGEPKHLEMTDRQVVRLYDSNLNLTLRDLSGYTGRSVASLKELLLNE